MHFIVSDNTVLIFIILAAVIMLNKMIMNIPELLIQVAAIFVALVTFTIAHVVSASKDRKNANREIYQQLELASIDLFRFEADHIEFTRPLWEENTPLPQAGTAERIVVTNYACQMLNLFEMSIRFRKEGIMPPDVFASWINWFYDLCNGPHFPEIWYETRLNYTKDLRVIIDAGIKITRSDNTIEHKKQFYAFAGDHFGCDEINLVYQEM